MITKGYEHYRKKTLDIYDNFAKIREELKSNLQINYSDKIEEDYQKIKKNEFKLLVLGEAKSGKSTFINAYLEEEILPMDVLECSSAIVEINKGNDYNLKATHANGGITSITGIDKVRKFLLEYASIKDEYRKIPVISINNELLIKCKGNVTNELISSFANSNQEENIYKIPEEDFLNRIKKYVEENSKNWGNIITKIVITCKLSESIDNITIVDSPGIGASGYVGAVTEEYLQKANAIIFVKSLTGQAPNSKKFLDFFNNNCLEEKKDLLFLVLTRKSDFTPTDFNRIKEEYQSLFGRYLDKEHILFVDSYIQLILNKCKKLNNIEEINSYFDEQESKGNDFPQATNCWLKARGDMNRFYTSMEEKANFNSIRSALEKFARVAYYIQLSNFLKFLSKEYENYNNIVKIHINEWEKNKDDPDKLVQDIENTKNEIDTTYVKLGEGIDEIGNKYNSPSGEDIIQKKTEKLKVEFGEKMREFECLNEEQIGNDTLNKLESVTMSYLNRFKELREEIVNLAIKDCNELLTKVLPDNLPKSIFEPNFGESDFNNINYEAEKNNSGINLIEEGVTFKTTKRVPYHHWKAHVSQVVSSIKGRFGNIVSALKTNLSNYILESLEIYRDKLTNNLDNLRKQYDILLERQKENNKLLEHIKYVEDLINRLTESKNIVIDLKEEVDNYVK